MTAQARRSGGLAGGNPEPQVVRGVALLVAAVLIGAFLLANGLDEAPTQEVSAGDEVTAEVDSGTGTETGGPAATAPPTTLAPARDPGEVTVLVANGSGVPGAASAVGDTVTEAGYSTAEPANASSSDNTTTNVYYVATDEAEAAAVATTLGLGEANVLPMPDPPPTADGDLRGATVLVVVGTDLAG